MLKRFGIALAALCLSAILFPAAASPTEFGHPADVTAAPAAAFSDVEAGVPRDARVDTSVTYEAIPMSVRAKVVCHSKSLTAHHKADGSTVEAAFLQFSAVFEATKDENGNQLPGNAVAENRIFGEYSPNVQFAMYVTNPDAHRQIVQGRMYYVDLHPVPSSA